MQVLGHHHIAVHVVVALVAVFEQLRFDKLSGRTLVEDLAPFPSICRNEVGLSRLCSVFRSRHMASGAKAPFLGRRYGGPKGPPFRFVKIYYLESPLLAGA